MVLLLIGHISASTMSHGRVHGCLLPIVIFVSIMSQVCHSVHQPCGKISSEIMLP